MRRRFDLGFAWICLIVAVVGLSLVMPLAPVELKRGTVQGFRLGGMRGITLYAVVKMGTDTVHIPLPQGNTCHVGGEIWIQRQRRIWGASNTVDYQMCPSKP